MRREEGKERQKARIIRDYTGLVIFSDPARRGEGDGPEGRVRKRQKLVGLEWTVLVFYTSYDVTFWGYMIMSQSVSRSKEESFFYGD